MYSVPFIYFSTLTYFFWQRKKVFDVAAYMSMLFAVTSLCCILMIWGGYLNAENGGVLSDGWDTEFGITPTLLYCGLITLTIVPFSFIRPEKLQTINNVHRYAILAFTLFIVIQGLIVLYLVGGSLADLLNGDFKDLKDASYDEDLTPADIKMLTMSAPIRLMYYLSFMTILGLPLFFYYSCVEKRSLWLTSLLLIISISPTLRGMLAADRTEIVHYGLMFFFCLVFFQNLITKKVRSLLLLGGIPLIAIGLIYIIAVSASRFEKADEGAEGSMLEYAGQSYVNFCYFYDNHNRNLIYIERETPLTSYAFFKNQYVDTKEERSAREGFFVGVFASHVGSWFLDMGEIGVLLLCTFFAILCCLVIKRYNRTEFDIADVLMLFTLGAVPTFGIFYYRYYSLQTAVVYAAAIALYLFSKVVFVWKDEESPSPHAQTAMPSFTPIPHSA